MRFGTSWHVETAVWRKIAHDTLDIVSIESVRQSVQRSQNMCIRVHRHAPDPAGVTLAHSIIFQPEKPSAGSNGEGFPSGHHHP
jgi:hypothetical protein